MTGCSSATHGAIDAVWRIESARVIAGLTRIVRDIGLAEELAQDALVVALEQWPQSGVPRNPGAWLMVTGKHRAIDHFRRRERLERKLGELGRELETGGATPESDAAFDDDIGDDLLRLMFTACHPVLSTEARVAAWALEGRWFVGLCRGGRWSLQDGCVVSRSGSATIIPQIQKTSQRTSSNVAELHHLGYLKDDLWR